ncbi:MAG TPA: cytochrome c [Holophagaceae bacterium]|nr:cytochrome c [Holophagaceae bacterium]
MPRPLAPKALIRILPGVVLLAAASLAAQDPAEAQFRKSCMSCHTVGAGDKTGPDLKGMPQRRTREWAVAFIQSPASAFDRGDTTALELQKKFNGVKMPELGVTPQEADALFKLIADLTAQNKVLGSKGIDRPATAFDLQNGKRLFEGRVRFAKGAPACLSCHSATGAGPLGGGRLGPQLNAAPARYGKGLASAIEVPAFPTMAGVFANRNLTPEEAFQVAAYLTSVAAQPAPRRDPIFPVLGFLGLVGSLELGRRLGRKRFRGVRKNLTPKA